jgi:predicted transcriptional regulator
MKEKIQKNELKRKAESLKGLVEDLIHDRVDIPDNALVVDLDATFNIFTKKRMELIEIVNRFAPNSVQELADTVNRTKQAVDRDLKLLERFDVIKLEKRGKFTIPIVKREMIILNLKKTVHQKEEVVVADVYLNNKPLGPIVGVPL